jgi:hypothetical protein
MIRSKSWALLIALAVLLTGLPLLGAALAEKDIAPYLRFPPATAFVVHAPFSWLVFCAFALATGASVAPFIYRLSRATATAAVPVARGRSPFPWWGWLGGVIVALAWWLAWTRFPWFAPLQAFTFSPVWLGYILVVNALTSARTGRCLLRDRPGYFLALFPLSAGFWWSFEYLNRFVQNWYYVGGAAFTPWEYFWYATLPFATVLPAVLSTRELLASLPWLSRGLETAWRIHLSRPKLVAATVLLLAGTGLTAIGVWPEILYPALWLAPLLLITALQAIAGEPTIFEPLYRGDWSRLWQAALAALVCGFFWELWNYKSLVHWQYSVPFVQRFRLFHMPLLGYAGYLPFGLECLALASLLDRVWNQGDEK